VPKARLDEGVKVATRPEYVTVPATAPPGPVSVKVAALIVAGFIVSLKVTLSAWPTGTLTAAFTGTMAVTIGGGVIVVKLHVELTAKGVPPGLVAPVVIVAE
jgi:hypothetical protein